MFSFQIFVGSRRELVANSIHTADADATQLDSRVASASAVCIGQYTHYCRAFTLALDRLSCIKLSASYPECVCWKTIWVF